MSRIVFKKWRGKFEKFDSERDVMLQRTIAGITPPGVKPGGLISLAEQMVFRPPVPVWVLGVFESFDLEELCRTAVEHMNEFKVEEFYCDDSNQSFTRYIYERNREVNFARWKVINLQTAPYINQSGDISYHVLELKKSLYPGKKILTLNSKRLASALSRISQEDIPKLKEADEPLVAALAYGFAQFRVNQYLYGEDRYPKAIMEYDIFADH
jgi:hypothetical protein